MVRRGSAVPGLGTVVIPGWYSSPATCKADDVCFNAELPRRLTSPFIEQGNCTLPGGRTKAEVTVFNAEAQRGL